jgi:uncharacterized peroxidase-related enzyme
MPRIAAIDPASATGKAKDLLAGVQKALGATPNLMRTMAQAPAVLEAYLAFSGTLQRGGGLSPQEREAVALTLAGENGCGYCASAHTFLGGKAGVAKEELSRNLVGGSADGRTAAILALARRIVATRGQVADADLAAARVAGLDDGAIAETVAHVALNVLTNYLNNVAQTTIDFPEVRLPARSA